MRRRDLHQVSAVPSGWAFRPAAIVIGLLVAWFACSAAAAAEGKRVMLLHSFGQGFKPWSEYASSIRGELYRQSPWPLDIIDQSLVTARSGDDDAEAAFVDYLDTVFVKNRLDLVISIGAPAAAFVQRYRQKLFAATPMVFTAVEQRRVQYSQLTSNDVVVAVWIHYLAVVENILHVLPGTKNLMVVVGTSPIEQFWKEAIAKELEPLAGRIEVSWTDRFSFEELLTHAAAMPPRSAILWELMIVDAAGVVHEGDAPLTRLHAVANAPIFSYDESFFGGQTVGGPFLLVADTSRQTVAAAIRILGGEKAADIKIPPVPFSHPIFDWRQLQRWGISESRLPPGSEIRFRNLTVWERYRWQLATALAVFLLQAGIITWLLIEHRRRISAEASGQILLNELSHANRVATVGQLTASLAHEIRQPLAAIAAAGSAGLNWLKKSSPDLEETRIALERIVGQTHRADEVVQRVRALFRHDPMVREEVRINDLIREILLLANREIDSNDIVLDTSLDDNIPTIRGDRVQLQQVILNLVMNAVEAMSRADRRMKILQIETATDSTRAALIKIADSGPGFDSKMAEQLFKPFFTTKVGGMGMGLPICRSIIDAHGGKLTFSSRQPQGALFLIVLPPA